MLFDWGYDNYKDDIIDAGGKIIKKASKVVDEIGEGVSGLVSEIGSVFV